MYARETLFLYYTTTQSRRHGGAFGGLAPQNEAPTPKLNHEPLSISWDFVNF